MAMPHMKLAITRLLWACTLVIMAAWLLRDAECQPCQPGALEMARDDQAAAKCLANRAAALMMMGTKQDVVSAIEDCTRAVSVVPSCKLLVRLIKCSLLLGKFEDAHHYGHSATEMDPSDQVVRNPNDAHNVLLGDNLPMLLEAMHLLLSSIMLYHTCFQFMLLPTNPTIAHTHVLLF